MDLTQSTIKWPVLTVIALSLAIGSFALGYFISGNSSETIEQESKDLGSYSQTAGAKDDEQDQIPAEEVLLSIAELSDPSRFDSRIARTAALVERLVYANESTLKELLSQSKDMQAGNWQAEVQNSIIQRWAVLNPIDALAEAGKFSETRQKTLIPLVYREWAVSNLSQAIDRAQEVDEDLKNIVIENIVQSRSDLSTDQLRTIARNLGHEWIAIKTLKQQSGSVPIKDPESELKTFLRQNARSLDDLNTGQWKLFTQFVAAWLIRDGVEVYEEIEKSLPQGYLKRRGRIFDIGFELAKDNPELALRLSVKTGSVGMGGLAYFTISRWADSDPVAALSEVSLLEGSASRQILQSQIMELWAANDPNELLDASRTLPTDLQTIAQEKALLAIAKSSPQRASSLMEDVADMDARDRIAEGIASSWARLDIDSALEWIDSDGTLSSKKDLRQAAINSLVGISPKLAFAKALELPPDEFGRGPEANAISLLCVWDVDMAIQLLPLARDNKTKSDAYDSVMGDLLQDHNNFRQAMDLFLELVEDVGSPEDGLFTLMWRTPMQLYQSINELPTDELKREAARGLLRNHESSGLFSDEQLAHLRELDDTPRIQQTPEMEAAFEALLDAME